MENDTWYWSKEMVKIFEELRLEFLGFIPPIVDREIIPDFLGSPDTMNIWLICEHKHNISFLKEKSSEIKSALIRKMHEHLFPKTAIGTLRVSFTSLEDIKEGGGRFYYFR